MGTVRFAMTSNEPSSKAAVRERQEVQYRFPYHYVPGFKDGRFVQHYYWDWGFRYLGGMHLILEELKKIQFHSLVDIGCGDGRLLHELHRVYPDQKLCGIDNSERAIGLARAFNPDLDFRRQDICQDACDSVFEVGTLVEVIEHIYPEALPEFLAAVQRLLTPSHTLLITVPHLNKPLVPKHHQHFNEQKLRSLLEPFYRQLRFIPFDLPIAKSMLFRCLYALIGGRGKLFILTNKRILARFYTYYLNHYLYTRDESACERIAVVCRK